MQNLNRKKLIIIGVPILVIVIVAIILVFCFSKSEYKKIESQMIKNAKEYIKENKIEVENQEYVFLADLDVAKGTELCSKASGVVVTNVNGKIEYTAYLKCIDYESKVFNNTHSYIELNGEEVVLINLDTLYFDKGYTKIKDVEVETVGVVLNEVGAYTINYVIKENGKQKNVVKRLVIVSAQSPEIIFESLENKEEPVINLEDEQEIILKVNTPFEEPGFVAYDYKDGKITKNVEVISDRVNTSKVGEYEITYRVTNSRGKTTEAKRKIVVVEELADLEIKVETLEKGALTNESNIEIRVSGSGVKRIILPDGTDTFYTIADYKVTENGLYTFIVEDDYGNMIHKSILIDNIDSESPTGSCSVEYANSEYVINVSVDDDKGVMGVDYLLNGSETGFLATTVYKTKEKLSLVEAVIKDVAGNKTLISCPMVDNNSQDLNSYTFKYDNNKSIIACNSYGENDRKNLEKTLSNVISSAETGSRAAVVEAVRFLVGGLDYRIPYTTIKNSALDPEGIIGKYEKIGLNIANKEGWGCSINGITQGLDSIELIKWAFKNANVSFDDSLDGSVSIASAVSKIKPGDLVYTPSDDSKYEDIGIIIGIDNNKIYIASALKDNYNSIVITEISKKDLPKNGKYSMVKQYSYEKEGNLKLMWD